MDHLMLLKQGVRAPSSLFLLLLRLKYKRDHDERRYPKKPQLYHSYLLDRQNCQNELSLSEELIGKLAGRHWMANSLASQFLQLTQARNLWFFFPLALVPLLSSCQLFKVKTSFFEWKHCHIWLKRWSFHPIQRVPNKGNIIYGSSLTFDRPCGT